MAIFVKKDLADYKSIKNDLIEDAKFAAVANSNENKGQMFKNLLALKYLDFPNPR